jgi:hypothetical protein
VRLDIAKAFGKSSPRKGDLGLFFGGRTKEVNDKVAEIEKRRSHAFSFSNFSQFARYQATSVPVHSVART